MSLLTRIGRQSITIGTTADCDILLGTGPPTVIAELIHEGRGQFSLLPLHDQRIRFGNAILEANTPIAFELRPGLTIDGQPFPIHAPAIGAMLLTRGHLDLDEKRLILGRDPEFCHLVISSPGVSAEHATLFLSPLSIEDHDSTSGTWVNAQRIAPHEPLARTAANSLALGPVPFEAATFIELHEALVKARSDVTRRRTQTMPLATAIRTATLERMPNAGQRLHRTLVGTMPMSQAKQLVLGRSAQCDIVLDYPQLDKEHAKIQLFDGKRFIEDLNSEAGTFIRGTRLKAGARAELEENAEIRLGPISAVVVAKDNDLQVQVLGQREWSGKPLFEIEARHLHYQVADRKSPKQKISLLKNINFRATPGDLIALMGPSGSGKTTLLHLLIGLKQPSQGAVLLNGQALNEMLPALRGSFGYVPQDDLVHPELTVFEAVSYSARLRLPSDTSAQEIIERVQRTLLSLGLSSVSHLQIGKPEAKILSGGQRKRVNIALELVTDPALLILDEPTSGLAADDTTALIENLSRLCRDEGKTIVTTIHQPAREEFERFSLLLLLGAGGTPLFFGPPQAGYQFFEQWRPVDERPGVDNPRDMFAELRERASRLRAEAKRKGIQLTTTDAHSQVAQLFYSEYQASQLAQQMNLSGRVPDSDESQFSDVKNVARVRGTWRVLLSRYATIKKRDRLGFSILLAQAPLIGLLLGSVFGLQENKLPAFCVGALQSLNGQVPGLSAKLGDDLQWLQTSDTSAAVFFTIISALWFGTSNAAREIVSERAIFVRERMLNLGLFEYISSKFLVLALLSLAQCTLLLGILSIFLPILGGPLGLVSHRLVWRGVGPFTERYCTLQ